MILSLSSYIMKLIQHEGRMNTMSKHTSTTLTRLFRRPSSRGGQRHAERFLVNSSGGSIDLANNREFQLQLKIIDLNVDDLSMLRAIQPLIEEHISSIMDVFYKSL